jgi:hypothetical protein
VTNLYSCDPGFSKTNATGRAEFIDGWLVACAAISPKSESYIQRIEEIALWMRAPTSLVGIAHVDVLVIENPKIYPGPQQKGDPDDVVLLATLVGMIAGHVPHRELRLPRPQEWKGNVPKDVMLKRIESKLEPHEKAVLDKASGKRDAILDAIGVGLWALGRVNQR